MAGEVLASAGGRMEVASIRSEKGIVTLLARWRVVNGFVDYSACQQRGIARNKAAQDRQWIARSFGLWLSLVERLPRVQEAVGSNPTSPMKYWGNRRPFRYLGSNQFV